MPTKRPSRERTVAEQLVFPFQLRVGDVILEEGARPEVVGRPTGMGGGKMMRALVRRQGEAPASSDDRRLVPTRCWLGGGGHPGDPPDQ
jgi:hypothetical protein